MCTRTTVPSGDDRSWTRSHSWFASQTPRPFSRCVVYFGEPFTRGEGEPEADFLARVDAAVEHATEEADRLCAVVAAPRERERLFEASS